MIEIVDVEQVTGHEEGSLCESAYCATVATWDVIYSEGGEPYYGLNTCDEHLPWAVKEARKGDR